MTWHRRVVIRILLLVAVMIETDEAARTEIKHLANHISVTAPKELKE